MSNFLKLFLNVWLKTKIFHSIKSVQATSSKSRMLKWLENDKTLGTSHWHLLHFSLKRMKLSSQYKFIKVAIVELSLSSWLCTFLSLKQMKLSFQHKFIKVAIVELSLSSWLCTFLSLKQMKLNFQHKFIKVAIVEMSLRFLR